MSEHPATGSGATRFRRRMVARDRDETHRPSSPLELLVDLCFVVAVSKVAAELHHSIAVGDVRAALVGYLSVFFAIWWAWVNFTWFASAFDVDDLFYRVLTLVQMAGILVLAAGVPSAFEHGDYVAITVGYVIMRVALVAQWLRVAVEDPSSRAVALRYAIGVSVVQVGWVARLFLPQSTGETTFVLLAACELIVPWWAERTGPMTSWHPAHIAERYGLFTIIVLGECILAGSVTVQQSLSDNGLSRSLLVIAVASLVLVFGLWWCYFCRSAEDALRANPQSAFLWGYAHYFVFASVAAIGAGLQVVTESSEHHAAISDRSAALAVAIPLAVYLVVLGGLQTRLDRAHPLLARNVAAAMVTLGVALAADPLGLSLTMVVLALVLVALIARDLVTRRPLTLA